ncbi:hypothetical protein SMX40_001226 [Cronobacter turicensis]|nr:hypothetical protein [Cronobacter turicensis]ELY3626090.1 hypothetical protein [Cronobacter turicensis]
MIAIKSKYHLEEYITAIKSWRIKELYSLKLMANSSTGLNQDILIRSGIVILYAHWEGFIKEALHALFSYLNSIKIKYSELNNNFIILGIYNEFKDHNDFKNFNSLYSIRDYLITNCGEKQCNIDFKKHISTNSNLNSAVLLDLLKKSGMKAEKYLVNIQYIDNQLLKYRNMIAHGEKTHGLRKNNEVKALDLKWYNELYEKITDLMDIFEEELLEFIDKDSFKKTQQ